MYYSIIIKTLNFVFDRDIGQSDSGSYFVRVKYNGGISNEAVTILKFNEQDELRQVVNTLLFLLATLIAILFFMMFVWHYWIQIYLRFRKLCTKYDSGFCSVLMLACKFGLLPRKNFDCC